VNHPGEHVSTRQIGGLEIVVMHAGLLHVPRQPPSRLQGSGYQLDEEGRPITGINGLLVRGGDAVVLVDPNSWEHGGVVESKMAVTFLVAGPAIEESLGVFGITPADVTHVAITHGHWDHYSAVIDSAGRPRFPNAEYFFPAADWRAFALEDQRGDADLLHAHLDPLAEADLLRLVEGDQRVNDSMSLLHTPGESPGHQVVRFEDPAGTAYYLGDLFHYPAEFVELSELAPQSGGGGGPGRDHEKMRLSRIALLERIEREGGNATLVFTHAVFPAWGDVERAGEHSWRWRFSE
jgi:glyoxylase-like metal-dependent hydrolase (beta-lactamase superfamily II)